MGVSASGFSPLALVRLSCAFSGGAVVCLALARWGPAAPLWGRAVSRPHSPCRRSLPGRSSTVPSVLSAWPQDMFIYPGAHVLADLSRSSLSPLMCEVNVAACLLWGGVSRELLAPARLPVRDSTKTSELFLLLIIKNCLHSVSKAGLVISSVHIASSPPQGLK